MAWLPRWRARDLVQATSQAPSQRFARRTKKALTLGDISTDRPSHELSSLVLQAMGANMAAKIHLEGEGRLQTCSIQEFYAHAREEETLLFPKLLDIAKARNRNDVREAVYNLLEDHAKVLAWADALDMPWELIENHGMIEDALIWEFRQELAPELFIEDARVGFGEFGNRVDAPSSEIPTSAPPRTPEYSIFDHTSGERPEGSPEGYPWVLWIGAGGSNASDVGQGMDSSGGKWRVERMRDWSSVALRPMDKDDPRSKSLRSAEAIGGLGGFPYPHWDTWAGGTEKTGTDFLDDVEKVTKEFVLPLIATVVGTAIGGVGGLLAAAAITAVIKISKGARVSEALLSTARAELPHLVAAGVFDKTLKAAKEAGLEGMQAVTKDLITNDQWDAFEKARVLGTAYVSQVNSLRELSDRYPEHAAMISEAARLGATPIDLAAGIAGNKEMVWMEKALARNAGLPESAAEIAPVLGESRSGVPVPIATSLEKTPPMFLVSGKYRQETSVASTRLARAKAELPFQVLAGATAAGIIVVAGAPIFLALAPFALVFYLQRKARKS